MNGNGSSEGEGERQRAGGRGSQGEGERQRVGGRGSEGEPPIETTLRDGTAVVVRMVEASDKEALAEGVARLSTRSRYLRFHTGVETLSEEQLRYLTDVDQQDHVAWVALTREGDDEVGIGVGRFVRLGDEPDVAEAAITVLDEYQGRGLGTLLLGVLAAAARRRGVRTFRAYVLGENVAMLKLFDALGADRTLEEPGVYRVDLAVPETLEGLTDTPVGRVIRAVTGHRLPRMRTTAPPVWVGEEAERPLLGDWLDKMLERTMRSNGGRGTSWTQPETNTMTAIQMTYRNRRRAAQVGLVARGVLYVVIGVLALQIAFSGGSSEQASQQGALQTIAKGPFGAALVALVGVGLAGYAIWRASQFLTEKGDEDSQAKDWVKRASYLVRALIHAALSYLAFRIAFGSGGGGGGSSQTLTARLMSVTGGRILVGLVGLIIIGAACHQAYQAFSNNFMDELETYRLSPSARTWVRRIGVAGHMGRAVVFGLIGLFLIRAAVEFNANEAVGLDGALQRLAQQPAGPWLLALTALGLFAFGVYSIVRGRYVDVSE